MASGSSGSSGVGSGSGSIRGVSPSDPQADSGSDAGATSGVALKKQIGLLSACALIIGKTRCLGSDAPSGFLSLKRQQKNICYD